VGIVVDPPPRHVSQVEGPDAFTGCENLFLYWDDVYPILSDMMVHTDDYPERYLIRGTCDGARLTALRSKNRLDELMKRGKKNEPPRP
jgi:hypothetical protein